MYRMLILLNPYFPASLSRLFGVNEFRCSKGCAGPFFKKRFILSIFLNNFDEFGTAKYK